MDNLKSLNKVVQEKMNFEDILEKCESYEKLLDYYDNLYSNFEDYYDCDLDEFEYDCDLDEFEYLQDIYNEL
jgi:hypothetical protein